MDAWNPKRGEPGYWVGRLRDAKTEAEFQEAYREHAKELEGHGRGLRPFDVLVNRFLGRFDQYKTGDTKDDERREDAIFVLTEVQRYLNLEGLKSAGGIKAASALRLRTIAEISTDVAFARASLLGFERSQAEFSEAHPAESATPTGLTLAATVDLECTGMDDHDPAPCPKCSRIQERFAKAVDTVMRERDVLEGQARNAGNVVYAFGPGTSEADLEKMAKDGIRRGAKAELELRRQTKERKKAAGKDVEVDVSGDGAFDVPGDES